MGIGRNGVRNLNELYLVSRVGVSTICDGVIEVTYGGIRNVRIRDVWVGNIWV